VTHTSNRRVWNHREARSDSPLWYAVACAVVLLFAASLRVRGWDASLFEDEVWVAELVRRGGWHGHSYLTPPLFYALQHAWSMVAGVSVPALRALPAFFGLLLAAIPLCATTRDRITRVTWSLLLAASSPLVFYSTRIKQYTLEACLTCALLVLLLHARESRSDLAWYGFFVLAALGVGTLYEPVFVLTGCALVCIRRPPLVAAFAVIFGLAVAAYLGWLSPGAESTRLHGDMTAFFGAAGRWVTSPRLFVTGTMHWVGQALNLVRLWWLAVALLVAFWLYVKRDWTLFLLAAVPPLVITMASAFHIFPYGEVRLMIVCFPALYLVLADAIALTARRAPLVLLLVVPFALKTTAYNDTYMRVDDLRPLYDYVAANHGTDRIHATASLAAPLVFHHPELKPFLDEGAGPGWIVGPARSVRGESRLVNRLVIGDSAAARQRDAASAPPPAPH
jgi:hypothetical protein